MDLRRFNLPAAFFHATDFHCDTSDDRSIVNSFNHLPSIYIRVTIIHLTIIIILISHLCAFDFDLLIVRTLISKCPATFKFFVQLWTELRVTQPQLSERG